MTKSSQKKDSEFRIPNPEFKHPVLFVGAGPGDPELITVRGKKALEKADLVVYAGSLVPEAVLKWTRSEAERINSASMHLAEIIAEIERAYESGKRVVRLHTGDPSLYGAIFEQMTALDKRSIPYRVIPGVTAAFAAAAALCVEFTVPEISQTLILTMVDIVVMDMMSITSDQIYASVGEAGYFTIIHFQTRVLGPDAI